METIGTKMAALRADRNISLAKVARDGGWSGASSVQRFFEPEYDISIRAHTADRLAKSLGDGVYAIASGAVDPVPGQYDGFAERIKHRLDELGMSQATLARLIGVSPAAVQQLCNGSSQRTRHILELASALRCDAHWLQTGHQGSVFEVNGIPQPTVVLINGIRYVRDRERDI